MLKIITIISIILIITSSCSKSEKLLSPNNTNIKGRWEIKLYLDRIEQITEEQYFWTFETDSTFTVSSNIISTKNKNISWNLKANKYKFIPFGNYVKQSIDYELYLKGIGVTENDCQNVLDINYYDLKFLSTNNKGYQILEIPFGVKTFETNLITLFPMVPNKSLEIRLFKK